MSKNSSPEALLEQKIASAKAAANDHLEKAGFISLAGAFFASLGVYQATKGQFGWVAFDTAAVGVTAAGTIGRLSQALHEHNRAEVMEGALTLHILAETVEAPEAI
jgi:hypothetical protein